MVDSLAGAAGARRAMVLGRHLVGAWMTPIRVQGVDVSLMRLFACESSWVRMIEGRQTWDIYTVEGFGSVAVLSQAPMLIMFVQVLNGRVGRMAWGIWVVAMF